LPIETNFHDGTGKARAKPVPHTDKVFPPGVRWNAGDRFLGRVQRRSLQSASGLRGTPVARPPTRRAIQTPVEKLAAIRQETIRPAVIIRKNTHGNRSQRGADCQAVLMSIYRTLKQRGHNPLQTITNALIEYVSTGRVPALPP
jgi:hypothetical protein